jgi:hypothetical protein
MQPDRGSFDDPPWFDVGDPQPGPSAAEGAEGFTFTNPMTTHLSFFSA